MKKFTPPNIEGINDNFLFEDFESQKVSKFKEESLKEEPEKFKPWRVFINHLDSYHGQKIVNLLSDRLYVNPQAEELEDEEEEEEEEEEERRRGFDEEEEEEETTIDEKKLKFKKVPRKYEVIGTTLDPEHPIPEDVLTVIRDTKNRDAFLEELMKCGIVIYDITQDQNQIKEAQWALKSIVQKLENVQQVSPKAFKRSEEVRYFILISTVMTWASTKPLNPDEPDLPFTEEDYRKRKPHPNFKNHIQCEKDVVVTKKKIKLKDKLKTLVICCGVTYGDEEGPLHHLFKMAWLNAPSLPILGRGNNRIPLLHVRDMTNVILDVLQNWPQLQYIVAVEQEPASQAAIVKAISKVLTTGKVKRIEMEEAFLLPEVTQQIYDVMTMNLNIDPVYITDRISWHLGAPFSDSISLIVKEYKMTRNLNPIRIIVLGPPASGKTKVAKYLVDHYDIHYIHVSSLIENTIAELTREIDEETILREKGEVEQAMEDMDEEEEDLLEDRTAKLEEQQELLDEIQRNKQRANGYLDDDLVNRLFQRKLRSKECQNQGYVMDGYPKTLEQAQMLFSGERADELEEEVDEEAETEVVTTILPELVVSLEASDDFLKERIIQQPEKNIQNTHYTEEHMIRRLKEYRKRNTDENTPLQFFDEIEIHPLIIDIEEDDCPDMFPTIYQCLEKIGPPRNYGLSAEEARNARKRAEMEALEAETAAKLQEKKEYLELKRLREQKMEEWTNLMEKLTEEQEEKLCLASLPLRNYLMKYVLPTLTQGLIEVANLRPDDPVDYLAEYLFKENPEGKMFEPEHTNAMASILNMIDKFNTFLLPEEEVSSQVLQLLKRKSPMEEIDSSDSDVCTIQKTTPCYTYDEDTCVDEENDITSELTELDEED